MPTISKRRSIFLGNVLKFVANFKITTKTPNMEETTDLHGYKTCRPNELFLVSHKFRPSKGKRNTFFFNYSLSQISKQRGTNHCRNKSE